MGLFIAMLVVAALVVIVARVARGGRPGRTDEEVFKDLAPYIQADAARRWAELTPEEQEEGRKPLPENWRSGAPSREPEVPMTGWEFMGELMNRIEQDRRETAREVAEQARKEGRL